MFNWALNALCVLSWNFSRALVFQKSNLNPNPWQYIVTEIARCYIPWELSVEEVQVESSQISKVEFLVEFG